MQRTQSGTLSILVADDNIDAATTLSMLLEMQGHCVRTAFDGQEAVRLVREQAPDLAVLDIGMPRMNGYEAAEQITGISPETIIFAVSGYSDPASVTRGKQAGFDQHFSKPLDLGSFMAALNKKRSGPRRAMEPRHDEQLDSDAAPQRTMMCASTPPDADSVPKVVKKNPQHRVVESWAEVHKA